MRRMTTLSLPPLLAAMVAAHNEHDVDAFLACFAEDAIVRADGGVYFGPAAIRSWFEQFSRLRQPVLEVHELSSLDGEPMLTGRLIEDVAERSTVRYWLGVDDDKIVALKIIR